MRIRSAPAVIVVLLVVALLLSALQCVAACTTGDCNAALPPCHQQHGSNHGDGAKYGCSHAFQLTGVHRAAIAAANTIAGPPPVIPSTMRRSVIATLHLAASSPPGARSLVANVLRI